MRAARTTTTTVNHWIMVDLTPDEALNLRNAIVSLPYASRVGPLLALWNNLTTAIGSSPPGPIRWWPLEGCPEPEDCDRRGPCPYCSAARTGRADG